MINFYNIILLMSILTIMFSNAVRNKRFVVYPRGGRFKIVIGIVEPVKLGSKQSMGIGWNFQFQYDVATNATQLVTYPQIFTGKRSADYEYPETIFKNDRFIFYQQIEGILTSEGLEGKQCLLRSICENAMNSFDYDENGLFGQILNLMLTPSYGDQETDENLDLYIDAQRAGEYGVECDTLYANCKIQYGILDLFSDVTIIK